MRINNSIDIYFTRRLHIRDQGFHGFFGRRYAGNSIVDWSHALVMMRSAIRRTVLHISSLGAKGVFSAVDPSFPSTDKEKSSKSGIKM